MRGLLLTACASSAVTPTTSAKPATPSLPWSRRQLINFVQVSAENNQAQQRLLQTFVHQQLRSACPLSEPEALETLLALSAPLREQEGEQDVKARRAFRDAAGLLFDFGPEDIDPATLGHQEDADKPEPSGTSTLLPSFEWVVEFSQLGAEVASRERSDVHLVDGLYWQLSALAPNSGGILVGLWAVNPPDVEEFQGQRRAEVSLTLISQLDVTRSIVYGPVTAEFAQDEGYGIHFLKTKGAENMTEELDAFTDDETPWDGRDLHDRAGGWLVDSKVKLRATVRRLDGV